MSPRLAPVLLGIGLLFTAQRSLAQRPPAASPCEGLTVKAVGVNAGRPEFKGAFAWWRKFARSLGLHHETTAQGIIRRFVSLDPGLPCTEFRRAESERILRGQPYLSDATITTTREGDSVRVHVATVDEVPVVVGARLRGLNVRAANVGTLNFNGTGMHVEGKWERNRGLRHGFGGKLAHPQVLGRPYAMVAEGMRRSLGEYYGTYLTHPFYTDLQRIAWHAGYAINKDFAHLRRPAGHALLQPTNRAVWNVGGVVRIGPPRRLLLVGGMVMSERVVISEEFSFIDSLSGRLTPTTDTAGVRRYDTYDATHVAGVLGVRSLSYSRMPGLDVLAAQQDVATGTQIGTTLGIQPWFRNPMRGAFAAIDAYGAGRTRRNFIATRVEVESRIDFERREWEHLMASGRTAWYFLPRPRWVSELSVEGAGGWRTVVPYQLELGDRRGGLRGFARSEEPGGQRLLARLEQRLDLGRYQGTRAAYGAALFADAGRMWAGDVPFGADTPIRSSVGAAILAAAPARSRRTMRAEIAFPLTRMEGVGPELRFTVREPMRGFWTEPPRIRGARLSAMPEQIFNWP